MKKIKLTATVFTIFASIYSYGQGCSDAGFCTMDGFKPNHHLDLDKKNNQFKIGAFFGGADNDIAVYGNYLEYSKLINEELSISSKLTTIGQKGNNISSFGLSDLLLNANYKINNSLIATLGTKIPLSSANKKHNDIPLPMDYQSSLGTFDLIFGLGYTIDKFQFTTAIQQPLNKNKNQFIAENSNPDFQKFQSTNEFDRSADVLLRVSYPFEITNKLKLTPSILPIYHLSKDKYKAEDNSIKEIKDSQGLTVNATTYLDYEINQNNVLQLNFGTPLVTRKVRPDGLTRSFIVNLEYQVRF